MSKRKPECKYLHDMFLSLVNLCSFSLTTDVHAWFIHVFCKGAAAGQTPQAAFDFKVTERNIKI